MEMKKAPPTTRFPEPDDDEATHDLSTSQLQDAGVHTHELVQSDFLILVVDDVVDNSVVISLDLQSEGYRVITASNGEEAVRVAAVTLPDIILMDIGMPGLDGLGATRKIRENEALREIPVIAITAFSTDGFRRAAYDAGFSGYLTKPLDFERLHTLIRGLLPVK
jgi:CheY-like chemotaxis protein